MERQMGGVKIGAEVNFPLSHLEACEAPDISEPHSEVDDADSNFLQGGHSTVQWTNPLSCCLWSESRLAERHGGVV